MILAVGLAAGVARAAEPDLFAPILHALDYLAVDYPGAVKDGQVHDQGEYAEQLEFAAGLRTMIAGLPARPERTALEATAAGLAAAIKDKRPGEEVAAIAGTSGGASSTCTRSGSPRGRCRISAPPPPTTRPTARCATAPPGGATGPRPGG